MRNRRDFTVPSCRRVLSYLFLACPLLTQSRINEPGVNINAPYNLIIPNCPEPFGPPIAWEEFAAKNNMRNPALNHVVIPCNKVIVVTGGSHLVFEKGITVQGKLLFQDDVERPIQFESAFILNLGWIVIGSETRPHKARLNFILTSMEGGVEAEAPMLGQYSPLDLGQKGFVTLGGRIQIFGKTSKHLVAHLEEDAYMGGNQVVVQGTPDWEEGDQIGIGSSILLGKYSSYARITSVTPRDNGTATVLTVEGGLEHAHSVRSFNNSITGKTIYVRPEVVKLNRNVIIMGYVSKPGFGGYFQISHSALRQVVEGVEFVNMGQAGIMNRYPLHYHFGGFTAPGVRLSRNSIHHSHHRCIVIQATHNVLVEKNIAYHNHGHCYVVADGIETGNQFIGNVAMGIMPLGVAPAGEGENRQTDNYAAGFYMTSVTNALIDNIVAGVEHTAYLFEPYTHVRGDSEHFHLPGYKDNNKLYPHGAFINNLAHSCQIGLNPGYGIQPPEPVELIGFTAWSVFDGFHGDSIADTVLKDLTIIDFYSNGIHAIDVDGFSVDGALIVGELTHHATCGVRDVTGIQLSSLHPFSLKNINFQRISSATNCQNANVGLEFFEPKGYQHQDPIHGSLNNVNYDLTVDTHYKISVAHPVIFQVGAGGSGKLEPNDSIVAVGWPGFDEIVEGRCTAMPITEEGMGVVHCPNICWKHIVLIWREEMTYKLLFRERRNGMSWEEKPVKEQDDDGNDIWVLKMTLPVGRYNMKALQDDNGTDDGGLVESLEVPEYERVDIYDDLCEGSIQL